MIIYFANRYMSLLGKASTKLSGGMHIQNDKVTDDIEADVKTLEFEIPYGTDKGRVEKLTTPGNYLLRSSDLENEFYTIIDTETDTQNRTVSVYAEDAGLDLVNRECESLDNTESHQIAWYIEKFAYDSGFVIGINEISDRSRTLSWEGEASGTERLLSIATQFDAEISLSFEIERFKVVKKLINIYKKRGMDNGVKLRLGKELRRVITKRSVSELATALKATGGTPEGADAPITLYGHTYDDGDIYLEGMYLKSRSALQTWSRYNSESGNYTGHILKMFNYDTTSQSELCNRAVNELKRISKIIVTHEAEFADVPPKLRAGDIVQVIADDTRYRARVKKIETSESSRTRTAELMDYE